MKKKPGSQPLRCTIYARAATVKKSDEVNSIAQQVERCKCFAKEEDWIVSDDYIFTDAGQSGLRVNSGLEDLMRIAAVNPKPFDLLLCTSIDRIARDTNLNLVIRIHKALKGLALEAVVDAARDRLRHQELPVNSIDRLCELLLFPATRTSSTGTSLPRTTRPTFISRTLGDCWLPIKQP